MSPSSEKDQSHSDNPRCTYLDAPQAGRFTTGCIKKAVCSAAYIRITVMEDRACIRMTELLGVPTGAEPVFAAASTILRERIPIMTDLR
jgi:hypothetical protein